MPDTALDDLSNLAAVPGAALVYVVSSGVDYNAIINDLFTNRTLVAPVLGTPASGTLTNCTGLPVATGISGLAANIATFLATPSSANLIAAITDETGSGALVFASSPTITTPTIASFTNATHNHTNAAGGGQITPAAFSSFVGLPAELGIAVGDETTAITTGTAKVTFRMPYAMTVTEVRANLNTVSSSGTPTIDINDSGTTILSTKITIDVSEKTSETAAVPPVISDSALADDAEITIDIDVAGTGAKGLKVWIIGTRA